MISVNGTTIGEAAIAAEMQFHAAPSHDEAGYAAARALVLRELLLTEAERLGIAAETAAGEGPDEALIRTLLERELHLPEVNEASCRRYYEANLQRFQSADLYEGAHILFAAPPGDAASREEAKRKAEAALERIIADPAIFPAMAAELSACPSAKQGGLLGQVARGDTVDEFETFMFSLDEEVICPIPVETRYGFHIIRLDRKIGGRTLPFEAVREEIATYLHDHAWRRAAHQYLVILVGHAEIDGIALRGAATPLVQ
jgi:peptidyl-prolyl cis-trans isomerase C